jgi:hypothetical protein
LEEVTIEHFLVEILPRTTSVEALVENRHEANLLSLIGPQDTKAQPLFKWGNNFSWAYNGNIADSMKELVRSAGGKVDGVIRFSLRWNDNGDNNSDLDAHCIEPGGNEIFFADKRNGSTTGMLDVDIINPQGQVAVENITWSNINRMEEGEYKFFVRNYNNVNGRSGFSAVIEYDGDIHSYEYPKPLSHKEDVIVARLRFSRRNGVEYIQELPSTLTPKVMWGVKTNQFHPVNVVMLSPNYWQESDRIGNKHYLFMLSDCVNDHQPNGFFNEFLRGDLSEHKRVFEALGSKMRVAPDNEQLSGLGFSSTKRNHLVVKVSGHIARMIKIVF